MIKNENYIQIQGWMINDLKLSGNELMTYALIYGFSQDGESKFTGSINYVCSWLNCTRPTASKALAGLVEKKLISKTVVSVNNVHFNQYQILIGGKETLRGGSKDSLWGG